MAGFLNPLKLEYIDGSKWKLLEPFEYCIGAPDSTLKVIVPAGFITDFASVPRFFWRVLPPTGEYGKAAVVHDYLYQYPMILDIKPEALSIEVIDINRGYADNVFKEAMQVLEVPSWKVNTMYWGVRAGGWKPWNKYREEGYELG